MEATLISIMIVGSVIGSAVFVSSLFLINLIKKENQKPQFRFNYHRVKLHNKYVA